MSEIEMLEERVGGLVVHRWPDAPTQETRPEIAITGIVPSSPAGYTAKPDFTEVTVPVGVTLAFTAELRHSGQVIPIDDTFRMPIRSRDGRERVLVATMVQGVITFSVQFDDSRVWEVTEAVINGDLPPEARMRFQGVKVYVVES